MLTDPGGPKTLVNIAKKTLFPNIKKMLPGRTALPRVPREEGALNAGGQVQQVHLKEGQGQVHRMGCQRVPFMNKHRKFYSSFYLLNRRLNIRYRYTFTM
jgi:hypothetical protein